MKKRIALLTGGGDAPGLNGIIESTCKTLFSQRFEIVGICDGFEGVFSQRTKLISPESILGIHAQAGTVLGTSNKMGVKGREKEFCEKFRKLDVVGLIAAGGDGTFDGLRNVSSEIKIIGVPKTIDNDLSGTEITFGFDTACSVVAESVDALRATADAHRRVIFVEAMGRTAGWIALGGGLASYADGILIPELPFEKKSLMSFIKQKQDSGLRGLVFAVAEGAHPLGENPEVAFLEKDSPQKERFGGIAEKLARWIQKELAWESRHVVLGHLQRSRSPTTTDRFLTLAMGVEVGKLVAMNSWGKGVVYREGRISSAPLEELMGPPRLVTADHRWVHLAKALDIFI